MRYTELHNHTHYSVLDGASTPEEYMKRAAELGLSHLAITDHGSTAGHREFQRQAKAHGIKPILGVEAYITPDRFDRRTAANRQDGTGIYNHITLLAKDAQGLLNLEHINKIAWSEGYYHKPRIDISLLEDYHEGIIALSGCMSGMIAKPILKGFPDEAHGYAQKFKDILGDDFYIEVMESNSSELNQQLVAIAKKYGIKPVVTSDCHMARKEDLPLAEAMLVLNTKPKVRGEINYTHAAKLNALDAINYLYPERKMTFTDFELWLHTYEEHLFNLNKHGLDGEALDNTVEIADKIGDYPYFENLDTLPKFNVPDAKADLREKVYAGLKMRGMDKDQVNIDRVEMELDVINSKGLADYFLIEKGFVDYAYENNILVGYGRGSAVSYLCNYCLGVTRINPMPYNLLPERFLSADREDPADIDTDLAIDGRYLVKANVQETYGNVSNIATIGYYRDKSAIKAAAKVFKAPFGETTKLTNKVNNIEEFDKHPDTKEYRVKFPNVVKMSKMLEGRIQNFGMHAGGIIVSKEPIENYAPVQTANDPSDEAAGRVAVAALDMTELADMGFVKYDLLGLRTLSIVDDTMKLIKARHGVDIDIESIPLDDKNLYDMISAGHTAGLFQAEATASTNTIIDMGGVSNFAELVASNALVRPGAANSTVGTTYIEGKKTGNVSFIHEDIREVTEETYGAVLYQEQQLLLCEYVAGLTKAEANKVRKAISKKIPEDLAVWKPAFLKGATEKIGAAKAQKVWKDLEASADYAFAKAHAVGYSMLTLLTAYLKYYYPIEFLVSSLNRMTTNKTDKMKSIRYLIEAKRLGIRVRLPHVNLSAADIEIQSDEKGDYIRLGLSQIKYISGKTASPLLAHRPFKNYNELYEMSKPGTGSGITKRTIGSLNAVGAAAFDDNPKTGLESENYFTYLSLPTFDTKDIPPTMFAQFIELKDYTDDGVFVCMGIVGGDKKKPGWRLLDIVDETAAASAFVDPEDPIEVGGVYIFLIANNSVVRYAKTEDVIMSEPDAFQEFLEVNEFPELTEGFARVVSFKSRTTRAGKKMADVVFCDENKEMISAVVWPSDFPMAYTKCKEGEVLEVGFQELDDGGFAVDYIK